MIGNLLTSLCAFYLCGTAFTAVHGHFDVLTIFKAKGQRLYKPPDASLPAEGSSTGLPLKLLLVSSVEKVSGYEIWSCDEQKKMSRWARVIGRELVGSAHHLDTPPLQSCSMSENYKC